MLVGDFASIPVIEHPGTGMKVRNYFVFSGASGASGAHRLHKTRLHFLLIQTDQHYQSMIYKERLTVLIMTFSPKSWSNKNSHKAWPTGVGNSIQTKLLIPLEPRTRKPKTLQLTGRLATRLPTISSTLHYICRSNNRPPNLPERFQNELYRQRCPRLTR